MLIWSGGAGASRRRPVTLSCSPAGRIQSAFIPWRGCHASFGAHIERSSLTYQNLFVMGPAPPCSGGLSRMGSVRGHVVAPGARLVVDCTKPGTHTVAELN